MFNFNKLSIIIFAIMFDIEKIQLLYKKYKLAIWFAVPMFFLFLIQDLWFVEKITLAFLLKSIVTGLASSFLAGFIFNFMMNLFINSNFIKKSVSIELNNLEIIDLAVNANHFKGLEAVGGKLYVTNQRIIFKSHSLNIQNHQSTFNYAEIVSLERYKTLGLVNNGLQINFNQNQSEKFVVDKIEDVISSIEQKIKK